MKAREEKFQKNAKKCLTFSPPFANILLAGWRYGAGAKENMGV